MPTLELEVTLPISATQLSNDLLSMDGVNAELWPYLKMTTPKDFCANPIDQWPINKNIFTSKVLLLGVLVFDIHQFKFKSVSKMGFNESSQSLLNSVWCHDRSLKKHDSHTIVRDVVHYQCRFNLLGWLLKPVYKMLFKHRHKRLIKKYA